MSERTRLHTAICPPGQTCLMGTPLRAGQTDRSRRLIWIVPSPLVEHTATIRATGCEKVFGKESFQDTKYDLFVQKEGGAK